MTLPPNRIEAAARAICQEGVVVNGVWRCQRDTMACRDCRDEAAAAITAAYPELANGTAWLAPMEATGGMQAAGRDYVGQWLPEGRVAKPVTDQWQIARETWSAMRDAFLQEPKDAE